MEFLSSYILEIFKETFDIYALFLFVISGVFVLLVDVPALKAVNYKKDAAIAKTLSIIYIILGPALYIFFSIVGGK